MFQKTYYFAQGGDNVVECVHEDTDAENGVKAYRSWNIPGIKRNRREEVSIQCGIITNPLSAKSPLN